MKQVCFGVVVAGLAILTLQGCGGDSGEVGSCSTDDKTKLSKDDHTQIESVVDLCTKNCIVQGFSDACLDKCFASALFISEKCGTCFGNLVQCGNKCVLPTAAKDCGEQCEKTLKACGVGQDVTPPRGNCSQPNGQNCAPYENGNCPAGVTAFCQMKAPGWPSCVGTTPEKAPNGTCDSSHEYCLCKSNRPAASAVSVV